MFALSSFWLFADTFSYCAIVASAGATSASFECPTRCNGEKHPYNAETGRFGTPLYFPLFSAKLTGENPVI